MLNVEFSLDGRGKSCFPSGFKPLTVQSLESRLIAKVTKILRLLYLGYQWLFFLFCVLFNDISRFESLLKLRILTDTGVLISP